MKIKILGTGCMNCIKLEENVKNALKESGKKAEVEKVTDIAKIMEYGVMSTPAIVIDNKVVSYGKLASIKDIIGMLD